MLSAVNRQAETKARDVRTAGFIPAVCYSHDQENLHVQVDYQTFRKLYSRAGQNTIINLQVEGKSGEPDKVLVHDVQYHAVTGDIIHVDFVFVRMDEEVTTHVALKFVGAAPAVKDLAAVLVTHLDQIEVRCLPADLIHEVEVDISSLAQFHDSIHVKDLVGISSKVKILDDTEQVIVTVVPPRAEEEEKPAGETAVETAEADKTEEGADQQGVESAEENNG